MQAFDQLALLLAQQVQAALQRTGHRQVNLHIAQTQFLPQRSPAPAPARMQVQLERATVLAHMAARYGFTAEPLPQGVEAPPVSSTEQRIHAALDAAVCAAAQALCAQAQAALQQPPATTASAWQWQARIRIGDGDWQPLLLTLDADSSRTLEHYALQLRRAQRPAAATQAKPAVPLHVDVTACLLEKTVSTADIQALRPGSVLPIALGRATVLLNGQALLSAAVAEHQGKLHLTAFETLE